MQVVFHIGAHCTDNDALIRSLLKNREILAKHGTFVPGPGRYRKVMSEALQKLRGAPASEEAQDVLFDAVLDEEIADRVILSNESFICVARKAIEDGMLYARAHKSAWLRQAFPQAEVEFAVGLRNPATFVPALYEKLNPDMLPYEDFIEGTDPLALRWSDYIARLQAANPGVPITVWCNEDTPLLWPEIMREIAGIDATVPLEGDLDLVRRIMTREGVLRLSAYLKRKPPQNEIGRRRVVEAFLEKYAVEDEVEQEIELPGWTDDLVDQLTELYDDDVDEIARMPGVNFLSP